MNSSERQYLHHPRSVWWYLLFGVAIRLLALNQPLVDAHLVRQTQTALITEDLIREPGWHLGGIATWRGDLPARLVLELPVYNYLIIPVHYLTGHLDMSGKLVSVVLWSLGFLMLQRIWRRCLTSGQTLWANCLFVFAPLSVFFGQAFMPEMLIQFLAFSFLAALLEYQEQPGPARLLAACGVGLMGMLVKGPEIAHLYLVAAVLVFKSEGTRALKRPVYWLALIVSVLVLKSWSHVMDASNQTYFSEWTSRNILTGFIGPLRNHLNPIGYLKILSYLVCFVLTPFGLLLAFFGLVRLFRSRPYGFAVWWVLSIVFFFAFWSGPVAQGQSYYNLPALGPCAMLFGLGVDWLLNRHFSRVPRSQWAVAIIVLAMVPFLIGGTLYLSRPDRVVWESTRWIREHTQPDDLIVLKANHRGDMVDYPALAPFPYYAQRRFWVYSRGLSPEERQQALKTSSFALVTLPAQNISWVESLRQRVKGSGSTPEDISQVLGQAGFQLVYTNTQFIVYKK